MNEPTPTNPGAWIDIANRFRRAVIRGGRLQMEPSHVRALLDAGFYQWLAEREGQEMRASAGLSHADERPIPQEAPRSQLEPARPPRTLLDERAERARAARLKVMAAAQTGKKRKP